MARAAHNGLTKDLGAGANRDVVQSETILLDLKHLLKEAKQRVPPVLDALDDPMERLAEMQATSGQKGCTFCGGLGHRIADCPKLRAQAKQNARGNKDYLGKGGFGAEM